MKLCEKATGVTKDKDGKEEKKELNICLTHHERLDGNTGMVLVSAAVRQVEGQDKQHFMVMVPLGMMLQAGMRATLYPKDAWEKVQKNEQVDESKLKAIKLAYTLCHPAGCTAEIEATPELINDLKADGGLVVFTIGARRRPGRLPSAARRLRAVAMPASPSTTSSMARRARPSWNRSPRASSRSSSSKGKRRRRSRRGHRLLPRPPKRRHRQPRSRLSRQAA